MGADLGMDTEGEIQYGSAAWQFDDLPLGGEDIDLIREQVDLDALQKLQRVAAVLLQIEQIL